MNIISPLGPNFQNSPLNSANSTFDFEVYVKLISADGKLSAISSNEFKFTYDIGCTPIITDFIPLFKIAVNEPFNGTTHFGFGSSQPSPFSFQFVVNEANAVNLQDEISIGPLSCIVSDIASRSPRTNGTCAVSTVLVGAGIPSLTTLGLGNTVYNGPVGYTATGAPTVFEWHPVIRSISPNRGSIVGGTKITISGQGFSNIPDGQPYDISIAGISCIEDEVTFTTITCVTARGGRSIIPDVPQLGATGMNIYSVYFISIQV